MKEVLNIIFKTLLLILVIVWVGIVVTDYLNTIHDKRLKFCLKESTHKYNDGTTYECVGLGYKMYKYERKSISATEFGPIFISERQSSKGINIQDPQLNLFN